MSKSKSDLDESIILESKRLFYLSYTATVVNNGPSTVVGEVPKKTDHYYLDPVDEGDRVEVTAEELRLNAKA